METIELNTYVEALEIGFNNMEMKKKDFSIIKLFSDVKSITLPMGEIFETDFVRIHRTKKNGENKLNILYKDGEAPITFPLKDIHEKQNVILFLEKNNILPSLEDVQEAFTFNSTLGTEYLSCGCCD